MKLLKYMKNFRIRKANVSYILFNIEKSLVM